MGTSTPVVKEVDIPEPEPYSVSAPRKEQWVVVPAYFPPLRVPEKVPTSVPA